MNSNQGQLPKANILVIDDTPDNLRLLSAMLTQLGYEVRRVINGQTALTTAQAAPPDLILLDIMMPDMNGYEVCQRLKASPITCDIPVIFISALDEVLDKVKAFAVGGVDYITKPFSEEEVFARVETNLTIRRLQKQLTEQNVRLQQEIESRQKAEIGLRLSQFYLHRSRDAIFFVGADARFVYVNQAACSHLGYSSEQLLTMTIHDIDPNFPASIWQSHWEESKHSETFTIETTHRTKDGRDINVEITTNYLELNGQEYHCALIHDITPYKQVAAELTKSEAKYRHLFENSTVGILRTRIQDGLILDANPRMIQMLGYSCAADVINYKSTTSFYVHHSDRQQILAQLQAKPEVHNFQTQLRQQDGKAISVIFSVRMNREEDCLEKVVVETSNPI